MASVEKRTRDGKVTWQARWRDPDSRQRKRSFPRKTDAERFMATVRADVLRGDYLDPAAGQVTVQDYSGRWLAAQTFDPSTREQVALRLRLHALPQLGALRLGNVRPSTVQAWLRSLDRLAPSYVRTIYQHVSAIFSAAVDDGLVRTNPCRAASVRTPRVVARQVVPWTAERVLAVRGALPTRYAVLVTLGAGLGLRQGEAFGLSPADVDWLRGVVRVRRQVRIVGARLSYGPPKSGKVREVPMPASVRDHLAAHLAAYPARTVALPWREPSGEPVTVDLVVTSREGKALNRNYVNCLWKQALVAAGVQPSRDNGSHALRHFYASTLLDAGESVKAVSTYLGHADPGFTLRTYTHLMPTSEERSRRAVDAVLDESSRAPVVPREGADSAS